ncbi:hypothetical protein F5Y13DRAFT_179850 [Hypoxylon sp. FL1857]|nr:hypothetical protein F5Y13DRAFT_179850 [Hypoxylon sp. FL1857]
MEPSLRARKRVHIARNFIDENAGSIHPVIAVPSHFVESKQLYVLRENHSTLEETLDKFIKTMNKTEILFDCDPKNCTWNDVLDQLDKLRQDSDLRQSKWFRKARRVVAHIGDDVSPWLNLIPDENGLGVLNGGLTIFFLAARRAERNRESILNAFGDIPTILQKAADKLAAFPSDARLESCVKKLYETILEELPRLIEMLLHKQLKRKLLAPITTQSTGNQIEESLDRIKRKVGDLDGLTTSLTENATASINQNVMAIQEKQNESEHLQRYSVSLQENSFSKQEKDKKEIVDKIEAKNALLSLLTDRVESLRPQLQETIREAVREVFRQPEKERIGQQSRSCLSLDEFLRILDINPLKAAEDLKYILKQDHKFNAISKGQASYLRKRDEFYDWFSSKDPDLLVVNGNLNTPSNSKISPLSLVCANLVANLLEIECAVTLYFFCSENLDARDGSRGPQRVMRSILAQLLVFLKNYEHLSLEFVNSRRYQHGLEHQNMGTLCTSFWELVNQLSQTTVFCIIDGVSLYEQKEWKEDLESLIRELDAIVHDDMLRPRLKILLTCPIRATYIGQVVDPQKFISLRASEIDKGTVFDRLL